MKDTADTLMTLDEAAVWAGCSTKTLYRAMAKGTLAFVRSASQRRLVREADLQALFAYRAHARKRNPDKDFQLLQEQLEAIRQRLDQQNALLIKALELFQPKTWEALAKKHRHPKPSE